MTSTTTIDLTDELADYDGGKVEVTLGNPHGIWLQYTDEEGEYHCKHITGIEVKNIATKKKELVKPDA